MKDNNCVNCGAPAEAKVCSYCKTPNLSGLVDADKFLGLYCGQPIYSSSLYGFVCRRPEMAARLVFA